MNRFRPIDLSGEWGFLLSKEAPTEEFLLHASPKTFHKVISLPSTVSQAGASPLTGEKSAGSLTDPRAFQGYAVYCREIPFAPSPAQSVILTLEKTRVSTLYVNGRKVGRCESLCSSHRYEITDYLCGDIQCITLLIDNVTCPVPGGHMTSPDTQTDWLGILGEITLSPLPENRAEELRIFPDPFQKKILVTGKLVGALQTNALCRIRSYLLPSAANSDISDTAFANSEGDPDTAFADSTVSLHTVPFLDAFPVTLRGQEDASFSFSVAMPGAVLWSEHSPVCYELGLQFADSGYEQTAIFGLRNFSARGASLYCNDTRLFLRGKHDGMLFPLTGAAPTDLPSWLSTLRTAKEYGINHYRFHTCCPPEAAFLAADLLGIYLAPELPFWGTVEEAPTPASDYLIREGFRILDQFGNHPSFFGLSLGNELWGSQKKLDRILADFREYDPRHLYTQGSNNFQFMPTILEHEDYFVGVRFSKNRLFRGSYAMCDAPLGHIQTKAPDSQYTYDEQIRPGHAAARSDAPSGSDAPSASDADHTMEIQYGTGVKTVTFQSSEELIPAIPVISHEIGQYFMYPDFREIAKYTGVLKPYNLELFWQRLENAGLSLLADDFFRASGRFAADCYKLELETALRSRELSGFQLLDLQDFPGQGTALVGILNAFLENKGIISAEEWRQFCNDRVLLGCLPGFVFAGGDTLSVPIKYFTYTDQPEAAPCVRLSLLQGETVLCETLLKDDDAQTSRDTTDRIQGGVFDLGTAALPLPELPHACKLELWLESVSAPEIRNHYPIWVYPREEAAGGLPSLLHAKNDRDKSACLKGACAKNNDFSVCRDWKSARESLTNGWNVLFLPRIPAPPNPPATDVSLAEHWIAGTYCTDFWNYPMFRAISESMQKPWPIGTLGLLIAPGHPALADFPTESYSTPQWYEIVTDAPVAVLDGSGISPIVRTIDNCERNHNLGLIWEVCAGGGKLLVCTSPLDQKEDSLPCRQLLKSLLHYLESPAFHPSQTVSLSWLDDLF